VCGIYAVFCREGGLHATAAAGPLASLRHRGPDCQGTWASPSGRAVLSHARLAVIDIAGGRQPIAIDEGALQIICSGEIYDHERLRSELEARGHRFATASDSEVALQLYAAHGEAGIERLRGEFAFVIWDERRGVLLAVRDRFGIKPLFYAWQGGRLHIASEVRALLAARIPAQWDAESLAHHLQVATLPDRTLFAGIRQVPPGCLIEAGPRGTSIRRWWDLDFPRADAVATGPYGEDAVASLRTALVESVALRLRADVPVAFHLSGGIDSSSVLALAHGRLPLTTFTVGFDDPEFDERAVAQNTARKLGAQHHEIIVTRTRFASGLERAIRSSEMVQENAHGIARYLQSQAISAHGYKVVLAGEGGDELFAGYPQHQRDLALTLSPQLREHALSGYRQLQSVGVARHLSTLIERLRHVPSWIIERYGSVTRPFLTVASDEFRTVLEDVDACAELLDDQDTAAQLERRSPFHQSLALFYRTRLPNYILAAERLDMAHAVEVRLPLLDHELFDVAKQTPLDGYGAPGATKLPLRMAMGALLPAAVGARPKQPFFAPPVVGDDSLLDYVRGLLQSEALEGCALIDRARATAFIDALAQKPPEARSGAEPVVQILASMAAMTAAYEMGTAV
jgi:asparagine synthase (glutamine-hydrolysing)